ncbi:MAG: LysM peptidoglycan-binding domain-containing protein [Bdellovibrionales bacterium]|nr:LysM peptidoglycan-binding domain-containing protein [Bdellovibrionales bacterium]
MKSRDLFLPSLTAVILAGMVAFLSCAHQNRYAEDVDVPDEDVVAESDNESSIESPDQASSSDNEIESNSLAKNTTNETSSTDENKLEDELEKLSDPNSLDSETKQPLQNTQEGSLSENSTGKEPSFEEELEASSPDKTAAVVPGIIEDPNTTGGVMGSNSNLDSAAPVQPKTDELDERGTILSQLDTPSSETLNLETPAPRRSRFGVAHRVPKIPSKAVTRRGTKLNRFYFVRKGDSANKVSTLIYGSSKNAGNLKKWNGKNWTPGKILYYVSSKNPKDPKMDSFFKENGVTPDSYTIGEGDWLSKIANNRLGSPKSWIEIAVVNGIRNPKTLETGQKIAVYPKDLTLKPEPVMIAIAEPIVQPPVVIEAPVTPPVVTTPPVMEPSVEEAVVDPVVTSSPIAGFNIKKFIEQNMFAGLMGLAGFFLVLLLITKKRKKNNAMANDDFADGEDSFQPPTKLKRK